MRKHRLFAFSPFSQTIKFRIIGERLGRICPYSQSFLFINMEECSMPRLGIVGFGHIGRIHFEAAGRISGAEVTAIASSRPDETRKVCGPNVAIYSSYPDIFQHAGLDAVVVCVPTYLHEQFVVEALNRDLAVLCEKPFALDLPSAQRMLDVAQKTQRCLMIAQVLRFWPPYARIKELVNEGCIGAVQAITAYRLAQYPPWGDWFRDPKKSGGAMLDMQIHDADFVYWLMGAPTEIYAAGVQSKTGSWDQATAVWRYPGAVATIDCTYLMPEGWPFSCGLRVSGSAGCLEFSFRVSGNVEKRDQAESNLALFTSGGAISRPAVADDDMYVAQLRYFLECVTRKQRPERCPPEESFEVLRLMRAGLQSLSARVPVRL